MVWDMTYQFWAAVKKSRVFVLFRTDSFKTHIDYRQCQKFLLVVDSFGPSRCGKYVLKSFRIFGQKRYK